MTEKMSPPFQTPLEKLACELVDAVNKACPMNLQADAVVCPCEGEHRPVYPVRYAYSNFYWDLRYSKLNDPQNKILEASLPPTIEQLLNAKSVEETNGFSARLLREGWVYVFEEGEYKTRRNFSAEKGPVDIDATQGRLLVFHHRVTFSRGQNENADNKRKNEGYEDFTPYVLVALEDGNVTLKANGMANPYLAIPKDVINASILFSEVKLSDHTLKEICSNIEFRTTLMQKVNIIDYENNDYCVELNKNNLNQLVEDYKEESSKFKLFINDITYSNIPSSFFGDTTTVPDLPQDAVILYNQMKAALDYKEKSTLILLKDPVGYQRDILSYYNVVTELDMLYRTYYSHPNKIGQYIVAMQQASENIKDTDNRNKMQAIIRDSVNQNALNREWKDINKTFRFFEWHQKVVLSLYESFMNNPKIINENGGLKHYVDNVFLVDKRIEKLDVLDVDFLKELNQLFELYTDLMIPLNNSTQGQRTLDKLYSINEEEKDNLWVGVTNKLIGLASKKSIMDEIFKIDEHTHHINNIINKLSLICYDSVAYAFTKTHEVFSKHDINNRLINTKGVEHLAQKVLPMIAKFSHAVISSSKLVQLSGKELSEWMRKLNGIINNVSAPSHQNKLNKLFDWSQKIKILGHNVAISIPKIEMKDIKTNKTFVYGKEITNVSSQIFLNGFSLITSSIQIYSLQSMSLYEKNNPLKVSPYNYYSQQILANLFVSFSSVMKVTQVSAKLSETVSSTTLKFFLDKIKLPMLTTGKGEAAMKGLGKVAGAVGVLLSARDAFEAFHIGNYKQSASYGIMALASLFLIAVTGGGAIFWGLVLLGGFVSSQLTSWSHLETLLKHSFWGNEKRSNFWNNDRPATMGEQLKKYVRDFDKYQTRSLIELQEFNNLFYTAKLTQEEIPQGKIRLSFELTNFTPGISEVYFSLVTKIGRHSGMKAQIESTNSAYVLQSSEDSLLFTQQLQAASQKGHWDSETGIFKFNLEVDSKLVYVYSAFRQGEITRMGMEDLYWYYQVNEQLKTPLRYLDWNGEMEESNSVVGFINSENI